MAKSSIQSRPLQEESPKTWVTTQLSLPLMLSLNDIQEGFFALCVKAGREVLAAMMEQDRTSLCGPKGVPNPSRTARRGGSVRGEITLGGRRIDVRRLRAHQLGGEELKLPSFTFAAHRDPLDAHTMASVAAGVATRKYAGSLERLPADESERSVSKSSVSRRFVLKSAELIDGWLNRPLDKLDLYAVMIDGIVFGKHTIVIALGICAGAEKHVLGLHQGSTENATVVQALIDDLVERGLPTDRALLFVIDGSKALRKAIRNTFAERAVVQRCQVHKIRNVTDHLPENMRAGTKRAMREAYESTDVGLAHKQLERLAGALEREHPGAAGSLREGMEETLTLQRLGIKDALYRTLRSTNAIENLNGSVVHFTRNVRSWKGGQMLRRWVGTALHYADKRFNRLRGSRQMVTLVAALERIDNFKLDAKVDNRRKAA
jgi:putative transposase